MTALIYLMVNIWRKRTPAANSSQARLQQSSYDGDKEHCLQSSRCLSQKSTCHENSLSSNMSRTQKKSKKILPGGNEMGTQLVAGKRLKNHVFSKQNPVCLHCQSSLVFFYTKLSLQLLSNKTISL